jgi:hypothetical protein
MRRLALLAILLLLVDDVRAGGIGGNGAIGGGSGGGSSGGTASQLVDIDGYTLTEARTEQESCHASIARDSSTTVDAWGVAQTTVGTAASVTTTGTNVATATVRVQYTSATSSDANAGWRSVPGIFHRDLTRYRMRFVLRTIAAGQAVLVGVRDGTTFAGDPSAATDTIYVGCNAADTNLSICTNDASGSATCTTLGASFPCKTSSEVGYDFTLVRHRTAGTYRWRVTKHDGTTATGTLSSDLPTLTAKASINALCSARASGSGCVIQPSDVEVCGPLY